MRVTPRGLVQRYRAFRDRYVVQQRRPHEYAVNRYYAHLIDPFFTKLAHDLGLSPNQVTLLAMAAGVGSGGAFYAGHWILAAALLQLHHFLDGADGNLARLTGRCSPFGAALDRFSDQLVRLAVFGAVALVAEVDAWARWAFVLTLYFDLFIIHAYVLPCMRRAPLRRAAWKQWFLDRGIIPGFDHFTLFLLISVGGLVGRLDWVVWATLILKNLDWVYRVLECARSLPQRASRA